MSNTVTGGSAAGVTCEGEHVGHKRNLMNESTRRGTWNLDSTFSMASTILVIDSDPTARRSCRRLLSQADVTRQLLECSTGEEALDLCAREAPDCILIDFLLPDMDAFQFLERLDAQAGKDSVPVVVTTNDPSAFLAVQAMREGAQDYLLKRNLTSTSLNRAVRCAIERHAWTAMRRAARARHLEAAGLIPPAPEELSEPAARVMAGVAELSQRIDLLLEQVDALEVAAATTSRCESTMEHASSAEDYFSHVFDEHQALCTLHAMLRYGAEGMKRAEEKIKRLKQDSGTRGPEVTH